MGGYVGAPSEPLWRTLRTFTARTASHSVHDRGETGAALLALHIPRDRYHRKASSEAGVDGDMRASVW